MPPPAPRSSARLRQQFLVYPGDRLAFSADRKLLARAFARRDSKGPLAIRIREQIPNRADRRRRVGDGHFAGHPSSDEGVEKARVGKYDRNAARHCFERGHAVTFVARQRDVRVQRRQHVGQLPPRHLIDKKDALGQAGRFDASLERGKESAMFGLTTPCPMRRNSACPLWRSASSR